MVTVLFALILLGLCFGSFVNALVWRLHNGKSIWKDRSECTHCHHKLAPADLVPVLSWFFLRGRCRYCRKPIEDTPLAELAVMILFVASYLLWPQEIVTWFDWFGFAVWLAYIVGLVALFMYDLKWYILPDKIVFPLIGLAIVNAVVQYVTWQPHGSLGDTLLFYLYGLVPIAGMYWLIHLFSKGKMVGFGDIKLGIFIGLALGWQLTLLTLVLANVIGSLIVLPLLIIGKLKRKSRVPFGPFLVVAFLIAGLFGEKIINWYISLSMGIG